MQAMVARLLPVLLVGYHVFNPFSPVVCTFVGVVCDK